MADAMGVRVKAADARVRFAVVMAGILLAAGAAGAQQTTVKLDPARTTIGFTLGATMHTVHGAFKLKSGEIRFDPATGQASGEIVVDSTSGNTENSSRDKKMHGEVLESGKFPEIVFTPQHVEGMLASSGSSHIKVAGIMRLHGQGHEMMLDFTVERGTGGDLTAATQFEIPFVNWGLKDPSTFVLRVDKSVKVEARAEGRVEGAER